MQETLRKLATVLSMLSGQSLRHSTSEASHAAHLLMAEQLYELELAVRRIAKGLDR